MTRKQARIWRCLHLNIKVWALRVSPSLQDQFLINDSQGLYTVCYQSRWKPIWPLLYGQEISSRVRVVPKTCSCVVGVALSLPGRDGGERWGRDGYDYSSCSSHITPTSWNAQPIDRAAALCRRTSCAFLRAATWSSERGMTSAERRIPLRGDFWRQFQIIDVWDDSWRRGGVRSCRGVFAVKSGMLTHNLSGEFNLHFYTLQS